MKNVLSVGINPIKTVKKDDSNIDDLWLDTYKKYKNINEKVNTAFKNVKDENIKENKERFEIVRDYFVMPETPLDKLNYDEKDRNELKYLNDLFGRIEKSELKDEDIVGLFGDNNFKNIRNKVKIVNKLPIYKNDADSIIKYLPKTSNEYNIKFMQNFIKK